MTKAKAKAHSIKYAYTFDLYTHLTLHSFARKRVDNSFNAYVGYESPELPVTSYP